MAGAKGLPEVALETDSFLVIFHTMYNVRLKFRMFISIIESQFTDLQLA